MIIMLLTLTNSNKKAIIDDKHYARVSQYTWYLKRIRQGVYYVATGIRENGKVRTLYLHRFIMKTKSGMDVHHKNTNSLDNQEENLEERPSPEHRCWHLANNRSN